jgi:ArsR family transcriptional regulator
MKASVNLFRALADETRLKMLVLMHRHGELCVCDFVTILGITQSKASRHLRYLRAAGLVEDRREAVWMHYHLSRRMRSAHRLLLESVMETIELRALAVMKRKLAAWQKNKGCQPVKRPRLSKNQTGVGKRL